MDDDDVGTIADRVGSFTPKMQDRDRLATGEVGYVIAGIKEGLERGTVVAPGCEHGFGRHLQLGGALHLDDVLTRRTRLSIECEDRGTKAAPVVAKIMAPPTDCIAPIGEDLIEKALRAEVAALPDHAITRGVRPFAIEDEWYYHMRFRPGMRDVVPLLTAAGGWFIPGRLAGELFVSAGLSMASAGLVILSGGYIEAPYDEAANFFYLQGKLSFGK